MPGSIRAKDRVVDGITERWCAKCREWLWIEDFCKQRGCTLGRTSECKLCRNERRSASERARAIRNGWVAMRELRASDRARRRAEREASRQRRRDLSDSGRDGRFRAGNYPKHRWGMARQG